jgi:hypothetical protein
MHGTNKSPPKSSALPSLCEANAAVSQNITLWWAARSVFLFTAAPATSGMLRKATRRPASGPTTGQISQL